MREGESRFSFGQSRSSSLDVVVGVGSFVVVYARWHEARLIPRHVETFPAKFSCEINFNLVRELHLLSCSNFYREISTIRKELLYSKSNRVEVKFTR